MKNKRNNFSNRWINLSFIYWRISLFVDFFPRETAQKVRKGWVCAAPTIKSCHFTNRILFFYFDGFSLLRAPISPLHLNWSLSLVYFVCQNKRWRSLCRLENVENQNKFIAINYIDSITEYVKLMLDYYLFERISMIIIGRTGPAMANERRKFCWKQYMFAIFSFPIFL